LPNLLGVACILPTAGVDFVDDSLRVDELVSSGFDVRWRWPILKELVFPLPASLSGRLNRRLFLDHGPRAARCQKTRQKRNRQVLDPGQVATFLHAAESDQYYHLYLLLLDTGMRPGEAFALQWADFDFAAGHVSINKSLEEIAGRHRIKPPKTKKSNRRIDLSRKTLAALQDLRRQSLAEGRIGCPVFHNAVGGYLRQSDLRSNSFVPLLKRAGLPSIRVYDLRHTAATLLLLADTNPKIVSERLGHSTIALTLDTYSHVLPTMQARAADVMQRLLDAKPAAVNG
jgi:integrase